MDNFAGRTTQAFPYPRGERAKHAHARVAGAGPDELALGTGVGPQGGAAGPDSIDGGGRIRTCEGRANAFTARPL